MAEELDSRQKDLEHLELTLKLLKDKLILFPDTEVYRIKIFDYDEYSIRGVTVYSKEVAELVYDISANLLTILDTLFHDAEECKTENDDKRFIERYSEIKHTLEKMVQELKSIEFKSELSDEFPEEDEFLKV